MSEAVLVQAPLPFSFCCWAWCIRSLRAMDCSASSDSDCGVTLMLRAPRLAQSHAVVARPPGTLVASVGEGREVEALAPATLLMSDCSASSRRQQEGPPIMVAFVGTRGGRWASTLGRSPPAPDAALLIAAIGGLAEVKATGSPNTASLVGIGVVRSWAVCSRDDSPRRRSLRSLLSRLHQRSNAMRFLEHEVLASAALQSPLAVGIPDMHTRGASLSPDQVTRLSSELVVSSGCASSVGAQLTAREVLLQWSSAWSLPDQLYVWPAWTPWAVALATGRAARDMTPLLRRQARSIWVAPLGPSRRHRQALLAAGEDARMQVIRVGDGGRPPRAASGRWAQRSGASLWHALDVGKCLKSQEDMAETMDAVRAYDRSCAASSGQERETSSAVDPGDDAAVPPWVPSATTMRRARVRFDVAAMLAHRERYKLHGPFFRFIGCDASPQVHQSYEVFVTVEMVVPRSAVQGLSRGQVSPEGVSWRLLPISTLGHGRAALEDKVAAHVHQVWCEYGPSVSDVQEANADVRQVLTDMGTELGLANHPDAVPACLPQFGMAVAGPAAVPGRQGSFMFPYALQTPGVLHVLDWIVREAIQRLPWWPEWQADSKRLLQYVGNFSHRERMRKCLLEGESAPAREQELAGSLEGGVGRFADWRWKTLQVVTLDLLRIEAAMRHLAASSESWQVAVCSRDRAGSDCLREVCRSVLFWDRVRAVQYVCEPLMRLMSWAQGCDCHEASLQEGRLVECVFKGCRAPSFAAALRKVSGDLLAARDALSPALLGEVSLSPVSTAMSYALACLTMKFHWVNELPYLIWQAPLGL